MSDFKDGRTHRDPKWPVAGYAPGEYMTKCVDCGETVCMDKRATQCFPCAVERMAESFTAQQAEIERLREALEPFAKFAEDNIESGAWGGSRCERERINVWFGPSDFEHASAALTGKETPHD